MYANEFSHENYLAYLIRALAATFCEGRGIVAGVIDGWGSRALGNSFAGLATCVLVKLLVI